MKFLGDDGKIVDIGEEEEEKFYTEWAEKIDKMAWWDMPTFPGWSWYNWIYKEAKKG